MLLIGLTLYYSMEVDMDRSRFRILAPAPHPLPRAVLLDTDITYMEINPWRYKDHNYLSWMSEHIHIYNRYSVVVRDGKYLCYQSLTLRLSRFVIVPLSTGFFLMGINPWRVDNWIYGSRTFINVLIYYLILHHCERWKILDISIDINSYFFSCLKAWTVLLHWFGVWLLHTILTYMNQRYNLSRFYFQCVYN